MSNRTRAFKTYLLRAFIDRCMFYLWTPAEDWILESMCKYAAAQSPRHLSLHYDSIKVDSSCVARDTYTFATALEQRMLPDTAYTVTIESKPQVFLLDCRNTQSILLTLPLQSSTPTMAFLLPWLKDQQSL